MTSSTNEYSRSFASRARSRGRARGVDSAAAVRGGEREDARRRETRRKRSTLPFKSHMCAPTSPESRRGSTTQRKVTFSFDSSGWMYVYHLGAAQYLQKHVLPLLPADRVAFSGSSGGSLVACTLCTDIDVEAITRFVIACQPECQFNPWRMLPCADEAIATFLPEGAHDTCKARLRVLVTRIELAIGRSFVRPEAVSSFASREQLAQTLRASCHIPLLGGLLPYKVHKPDGTSSGAYYDGLFWPSILYMWRAFDASDTLLKVSGLGWPTAHVALPLPVPVHWLVLPPRSGRYGAYTRRDMTIAHASSRSATAAAAAAARRSQRIALDRCSLAAAAQ